MSVTRLMLERFGPFSHAELDLCPGINVLLGTNSTGKTFAAKALYAVLKGLGDEAAPSATPRELLRDKLAAVFRPDDGDVRRLVSRIQGRNTGRLRVEFNDRDPVKATISSGKNPLPSLEFPRAVGRNGGPRPDVDTPVLFLPSREVLAMYEGFVAAYQLRELSFDETYYDTAVALSAAALRGRKPRFLRETVDRLEGELGGKPRLEGARFYLVGAGGRRLEAHLLAEGLRKVATVVHLINNGALRPGGVLIWDEPEANLHPRLAEVVVECLGALARGGVQILVATHDYLIADAISRWTEYPEALGARVPVRFFQHLRDEDGVRVEAGEAFAHLDDNPLLQAFLDHHDREQSLIAEQIGARSTRSRR